MGPAVASLLRHLSEANLNLPQSEADFGFHGVAERGKPSTTPA